MKQAPKIVSIVVLTQVLGCASMIGPPGTISEQVDYWLDKQEYGKALAIVAGLQEHPVPEIANSQILENKVLVQAGRYEQQVVAVASNAAARNDWRTALDLYEEALTRLPNSEKLKAGRQQLIQQQEASLAKLQLDLLVAQAESAHKELLIDEKVVATDPNDWFAQHELDNKIEESEKLANDLAEYGRRALVEGNLEQAKRTLPLAMKLSSAPDIKIANTRLDGILKEQAKRLHDEQQRIALEQLEKQQEQEKVTVKLAKKKQKKQQAVVEEKNEVLGGVMLVDFKKACEDSNFAEAKRLQQKLEKLNIANPEFDELVSKLDKHIAKHVQLLTEKGTQYYSGQQYEKAMEAWQEAQTLDTKNEQINAHLERVSRVLEKLQSLKQQQGVELPVPAIEK